MKLRIATIVLAVLFVVGGVFCGITIVSMMSDLDRLEANYMQLLSSHSSLESSYDSLESNYQALQSEYDTLRLKSNYNEVKLEIEQFFIANNGYSYYPAGPANLQEISGDTIEWFVNHVFEIIAQYYGNSDWQSFCASNGITPAQAAAYIEWVVEAAYDDVKIVYEPQQSELTAWVYFPKTKEGETLDGFTLGGSAFLESTRLFVGAPSAATIEFDNIYTACYALGIDTFNWWQTPEGNPSILFTFMK